MKERLTGLSALGINRSLRQEQSPLAPCKCWGWESQPALLLLLYGTHRPVTRVAPTAQGKSQLLVSHTWRQHFTQAALGRGRTKRMGRKEKGPWTCTPCQPQNHRWALLQPLQWERSLAQKPRHSITHRNKGQGWEPQKGTFLLSGGLRRSHGDPVGTEDLAQLLLAEAQSSAR